MNVGSAIAQALKADATVAAITTNVTPLILPQRATVGVVFRWSREWEPLLTLDAGVEELSSVELACIAADYDTAHSLADAVRGVLDGASGNLGSAGITFGHVSIRSQEDTAMELSGDKIYYGVVLRYDVMIA